MTKEVSIIIDGVQIGTEEEPIIMTASGTYHLQNDKHYIQYEEPSEDGQGTIKNRIKITPSQVEMTKKGASDSQMNFDLNHSTEIIYQTPYGNLFFEVKTNLLEVIETEKLIEVKLEYTLYSNGDLIAEHRTIIRINSL